MTTIRRSDPYAHRRGSKTDGTQDIRAFLLEVVAQGAVGPGGKLPTERELAARFALPRNTVRKTLAQLRTTQLYRQKLCARWTAVHHVGCWRTERWYWIRSTIMDKPAIRIMA